MTGSVGGRRAECPMSEFSPETLLRTLEAHGVDDVVIGAQAALIHGAPVVTSDMDVTPARDPENLERIAAALRDLGARLRTPGDGTEGRFRSTLRCS